MLYKIVFPTILTFLLLLNACSSNTTSDNTQVFTLQEKIFVHNLFLSEYLWYDQVASNLDYALFNAPQTLINELRISPPDKWSFTLTEQAYEDFSNQKTVGFGFGHTQDFSIFLVRINAPAYKKLYRGDKILFINGQSVTQDIITTVSQNTGVATTFTVLRNSNQLDIVITPVPYTFKVSLGKLIDQNTTKIGYLRYDSFTESSISELETIFTTFKTANISELIIDLRYNGGGSIITASTLLDNISNAYAGERQIYLDWNANYKTKNETYTFEDIDLQDGNELTMQRVVFLVTEKSASASELVISALKPYLGNTNVITVGSNTHGKPVGMSGRTYGINYYFLANFLVRNNSNNTTSFDGISPTCRAEDDLTHAMGDTNETMLSTALYYVQNDTCP
ncbi:MAG: hypothetical protein COA92_08390 [Sulfurovum sp.]|nr:MAG: hypothetical protein COA92_08390 [Sulfurovum sp.]